MPRIEEALQAVKAAVWFTSFDLAQGYLQLSMDEADIHKTAFRTGLSGLYEFTQMPFGLSNAGASFYLLRKSYAQTVRALHEKLQLSQVRVVSAQVGCVREVQGLFNW